MKALLISTYEMGRQPFGLASPAAWLKADGWAVLCVDAARQRLTDADVAGADLVGIHLPMHTATRLAGPVVEKVKRVNPAARVCAYGLYAPLNAGWLKSIGVDAIFGGEFEQELSAWAGAGHRAQSDPARRLPRLHFIVPDRSSLPPLSKYATLQMPDGTRRLVGYTEATRGCKHLCRHCPVVPIYEGQFRVVQPEVVAADIDAQVAAGARHITFGDPDFFNGPAHALRIVEAFHDAHREVTYDVTIKIEHLLKHRELLPRLRDTGCAFVTSAVESVDDRVLALLRKGHTRADFLAVVGLFRSLGMTLAPTFVAFHPWTTLASYCDMLDVIEQQQLVDQVAPIQLGIRLLIPQGSRMLELDDVRQVAGAFDPGTLTYRWTHGEPEIDRLHEEVVAEIGSRLTAHRRQLFDAIARRAHERAGLARPQVPPLPARATIPYLNEPWYC